MGMAQFRRPVSVGRGTTGVARAIGRAAERRDLPAECRRRQRQGPRRADGHKGPEAGRCARSRAVDSGHEAVVPAARGRGLRGARRAPAAGARDIAARLHARGVSRGIHGPRPRRAYRTGAQAPGPLHDLRLHGRVLRRDRRWPSDAHDRSRGGGRRRRARRRARTRPAGLPEHELPARPRGADRRCPAALRGDRRRHEFGQVPRGRTPARRRLADGDRSRRRHPAGRRARVGRPDRARRDRAHGCRNPRDGRGSTCGRGSRDRGCRHRGPPDGAESRRGACGVRGRVRHRGRGDFRRGGEPARLPRHRCGPRHRHRAGRRVRHRWRQQPVHVRPRGAHRRAVQRRRRRRALHGAVRPRSCGVRGSAAAGARGDLAGPVAARRPRGARRARRHGWRDHEHNGGPARSCDLRPCEGAGDRARARRDRSAGRVVSFARRRCAPGHRRSAAEARRGDPGRRLHRADGDGEARAVVAHGQRPGPAPRCARGTIRQLYLPLGWATRQSDGHGDESWRLGRR